MQFLLFSLGVPPTASPSSAPSPVPTPSPVPQPTPPQPSPTPEKKDWASATTEELLRHINATLLARSIEKINDDMAAYTKIKVRMNPRNKFIILIQLDIGSPREHNVEDGRVFAR